MFINFYFFHAVFVQSRKFFVAGLKPAVMLEYEVEQETSSMVNKPEKKWCAFERRGSNH